VWTPFGACVLQTIALGIYAFRVGKGHSVEVAHEISGSVDGQAEALEQGISDAGREREVLRTQLAERDKVIAGLRLQTEQQARSLNEMKSAQANLEQALQTNETESSEWRMNEPALRRNWTRLSHRCNRCDRNSILRARSVRRTNPRTPACRVK